MINVRLATENDLPQILEIYNDVILHTNAVWDYNPHSLKMRQAWFSTKQQQGFPLFVAEQNNIIVGYSTIGSFRQWDGYKNTVENTIHIAANYRGKGIGNLLMPPIIEAAKKLNLHTIIAGIDGDNEASIKLHEKFGFTEVAHLKQVGFKFGKWLDLKFYQLIIN